MCWALDLSDFYSNSKMDCAFYFWIHTGKPIKLKGYSFHYICLQAAQIEMQTTSIEWVFCLKKNAFSHVDFRVQSAWRGRNTHPNPRGYLEASSANCLKSG